MCAADTGVSEGMTFVRIDKFPQGGGEDHAGPEVTGIMSPEFLPNSKSDVKACGGS